MSHWPAAFTSDVALSNRSSKENAPAQQCIPLNSYAFFSIEGEDAEHFLQGQLTCDVNALNDSDSQYGAHCNPKGRVISNFVVSRLTEHRYGIKTHNSLGDIASAALSKYSVFSKASILQQNDWLSFGLIGSTIDDALSALQKKISLLAVHRLHNTLCECWIHRDDLAAIQDNLLALGLAPEYAWQEALIEQGIVELQASQSEQFLPQALNLENLGALSYTKGCYTGQEVIARLHYKGKLKKHIAYGCVANTVELTLSDILIHKDSQKKCAELLMSANNTEHAHITFLALVDGLEPPQNIVFADHPNATITWKDLATTAIP